MNAWIRSGAYIAISSVFFSLLVVLAMPIPRPEIPYFGVNLFAAFCFILGLVSFSGATLFLISIKNEVKTWYLEIPLIAGIAAVTILAGITPVLSSFCNHPLCSGTTYPVASQIMIYLLAPFSALFFYSLKEIQNEAKILILASLGISILFSGSLIIEIPMHDISASFLFYLVIGMPLIGAGFLVTCVGFSEAADEPKTEVKT